jgi:hypothetical protein
MAMPKLKYFIQCDEVRNENNKLSAVGLFDTIHSFIFPATHKKFFLLMGFFAAEGKFDLELQFGAPDGNILARTKGDFELNDITQVANVVFAFEDFQLPAQGRYSVSIFLDGDFFAEHFFRAMPPFPKRQRTDEEIRALLNQPDIIKSANIDVPCSKCRTLYRFQHHLDPVAPAEAGFLRLPPGEFFVCSACGQKIELRQIRDNLENIVGIPRQWLGPAPGQSGGSAVPGAEGDNPRP